MMHRLIAKLPKRFEWSIHNIVGHPLSELLHLLGYTDLGDAIHDMTVPAQQKEKE